MNPNPPYCRVIFCFLAALIMILWYDLDGDKRLAMQAKLRELGL